MKLTDMQKKKVEELLKQMTLEEKIGQMNQESPSIVGGFDVSFEELIEMSEDGRISREEFNRILAGAKRDFHEDEIRRGLVGSMMGNDPVKANELQKIAVEESRLGIPLIFGYDVIHGLRSVYPIAIAEAGSFDDDLFEKTAKVAASESRAYGVDWNFAPMIDVARDARWGRVSEGPGEDPYLASRFARKKIQGLQNDHTGNDTYVAACTKHYVAYGACEGGRDYNTTSMSESLLRNVYLPPFKAAMEEGACTVMASFNDLNGIPMTVNRHMLRDVLKDEFDLEGFVVSDANAIRECINHGIAENETDAGIQAALAGLDMDMGTHIYKEHLQQAVEKGKVPIDVIDDAVRRILSVKVWLGLFENPYVPQEVIEAYQTTLPESHVRVCRQAAEESIVLLKNENNVLPLSKEAKVSLAGNLAQDSTQVVGAWAMGWDKKDCVSILDGFHNIGANMKYFACGGPEGDLNEEEIREAAEYGDVIVAVIGETTSMTGEASSKTDLYLPGEQKRMLKEFLASGKPVIAVLMNGRPLALGWEEEHLAAIVEAWHLGIQMGNAVAEVLYGTVNPSGKLASSFPAVNGQEPTYYNYPNTGRPAGKSKFTSKYTDAPASALYPFGYGLSYTEFSYKDLDVKGREDLLEIRFTLENIGKKAGTEVCQLYLQDVTASLVRPVRELKGYQRVTLGAGEKQDITFLLKKEDMGFYNNDGEYVLEDGLFQIFVGGNSRDGMSQELKVSFAK